MLHFRFNMPLYLMALYGSIMILAVLLFRGLLKNKLPKFVFPILWSLLLLRLLLPFSISSPISAPVPSISFFGGIDNVTFAVETADTSSPVAEGTLQTPTDSKVPLGTISQYTASNIDSITEETIAVGNAAYGTGRYSLVFPTYTVIFYAYILGLSVTLGILLVQKLHYSKKLKNRLLLEHNKAINAILREMNMGHILVFSNDEIVSPLVCGLLHPSIYLPTRLNFDNAQLLRHILAHETMHIKRKDNWIKVLMLTALCVHWYNPLVWWMAKCLSSDLEAACDAAVLKNQDTDYRKDYASSLLTMSITGNHSTLLYSSFARTEVEKRIRNVLNYRKTGVFMLLISVLFISTQTVVFATAGQSPFSTMLSSYCSSDNSRWGVKAELARDISTGPNAKNRADKIILDILSNDTSNDPDMIGESIKTALAKEFSVEKSAFVLNISLYLDEDTKTKEYSVWDLQKGEDGFYLYKGNTVRTFQDPLAGCYQSKSNGQVDLIVNRDHFGEITSLTVFTPGDHEYDQRTHELGYRTQDSEHYTEVNNTNLAESVTVDNIETK